MLSKYLEPIKNAPSMGIESSALLTVGVWCWSKRWKLDGDVMWCRCCKRGIHITRMGAPLNHTAGCKNDDDLHPWHSLARLMAPIDALSSAPECTDEGQRPEMPTANVQAEGRPAAE